ncbi:MAG: hypothetical protein IAE80_13170 [Anaerolinea sp.]|nr:hypothetical protein [Anaerolinea sp.]
MAYLKGEENLFLKIQNTADSANSLDDDNRRDIADLVRNLLNDDYEIFILTQIVEGRSGSLVFLVEVTDLHSTPRETYPCYLKIHRDADEARAFEKLLEDDLLLLRDMPRIIDKTVYKRRLAVLSFAAFGEVDRSAIVPLTTLIRDGSPQLQKYLNGALLWLDAIPKNTGSASLTLYQLLRCTLERSITDYDGHKSLTDFLTFDRSVRGAQSVGERYAEFGCNVMRANDAYSGYLEQLSSSPAMAFSGENLPNPIYYLQNESMWISPVRYDVLLSEAHGDLHADNIICRTDVMTGDDVLKPNVIDPGKACSEQLSFFDYAYLEFNVIRLRINRDDPKKDFLQQAQELIKHWSTNILPQPKDVPNDLRSVQESVQTIRQCVKKLIAASVRHERSFWVAVIATGLNFARKRFVIPADRTLAMLYAAYGLRRLSSLEEVSAEWQQARSIALSYWLNPPADPYEDVDPQASVDTTAAIDSIAKRIRSGKSVLFVVTADENAIKEDVLVAELGKRLKWLNYAHDTRSGGVRQSTGIEARVSTHKVSDMLRTYEAGTSETNLRSLIRYLVDRETAGESQSILDLLGQFGDVNNTYFATTDWNSQLDQSLLAYAERKDRAAVAKRVFRLCGDVKQPGVICWQDALEDSPARSDLEFNRLLQEEFIVLLGSQPWHNTGWKECIGKHLRNQSASARQVWYVNEHLPRHVLDKEYQGVAFVQMKYHDFLRTLLEKLHVGWNQAIDAGKGTLDDPLDYAETHGELIARILDEQRQYWLLLGEPGSAKTMVLNQLVAAHEKRYPINRDDLPSDQRQIRFAAVIDLAQEEAFKWNHFALLFLLFDTFHRHVPNYEDYRFVVDCELELFTRFMDASDAVESPIPMLLAFDNFVSSEADTELTEWVMKTIWYPFIRRKSKLVYAMRFPYAQLPKQWHWRFWKPFEVVSMPSMTYDQVHQLVTAVWQALVPDAHLIEQAAEQYYRWTGGHAKTIFTLRRKDEELLNQFPAINMRSIAPKLSEERKREVALQSRHEVFQNILNHWRQQQKANLPSDKTLSVYGVPFYLRRFSSLEFTNSMRTLIRDAVGQELDPDMFQDVITYLHEHGYIYDDAAFPGFYFVAPSIHRLQFDMIVREIIDNFPALFPYVALLRQIHNSTEGQLNSTLEYLKAISIPNDLDEKVREDELSRVAKLVIDAVHYYSAIHDLRTKMSSFPVESWFPEIDLSQYDEERAAYFERLRSAILQAEITDPDDFDSLLAEEARYIPLDLDLEFTA